MRRLCEGATLARSTLLCRRGGGSLLKGGGGQKNRKVRGGTLTGGKESKTKRGAGVSKAKRVFQGKPIQKQRGTLVRISAHPRPPNEAKRKIKKFFIEGGGPGVRDQGLIQKTNQRPVRPSKSLMPTRWGGEGELGMTDSKKGPEGIFQGAA